MGLGRIATRHLTRVSLELMPRRGARRWLLRSALILGALGAGAAVGVVGRDQAMAAIQAPAVDAVAAQIQPLRAEIDQNRSALRLATARSQELERQVDALNQRLRETTEELTFFRRAREARH